MCRNDEAPSVAAVRTNFVVHLQTGPHTPRELELMDRLAQLVGLSKADVDDGVSIGASSDSCDGGKPAAAAPAAPGDGPPPASVSPSGEFLMVRAKQCSARALKWMNNRVEAEQS